MKKSKILLCSVLASTICFGLASCGSSSSEAESGTINLTIWNGGDEKGWYAEQIEAFKAKYETDTLKFEITQGVESESTVKDTILTDVEAAADVFSMADDQVLDLVNAGALQSIGDVDSTIAADVKSRNNSGSVTAATKNNILYAFPATADNGFFLYYDNTIVTKEQTGSYETMLAALKAKSTSTMKYVLSFPFNSGWYLDGWFSGAGLSATLNDTTGLTECDWNSEQGVKVCEAIMKLTQGEYKDYFYSQGDETFASDTGRTDTYRVAAGVNGAWNSETIKTNYGAGYAAGKLPTYNLGTTATQERSVAGFKLFGVNKYSANTKWAVKLANFLTEEDAQASRFTEMGSGPSNTVAAAADEVKANVALSGLIEQSNYGSAQSVSQSYWKPTESLAAAIYNGMNGTTDLIASGRGTSTMTFNEDEILSMLNTSVTAIEAEPTDD